MKKTSFYNFFPTKAEEEEGSSSSNRRHGEAVRSTEVEIRKMGPRTQTVKYIGDKWPLTKVLAFTDIERSRLCLPQGPNGSAVYDHIIRYLPKSTVENILAGCPEDIRLKDVDNQTYHDVTLTRNMTDCTFLMRGHWKDEIVKGRNLQAGYLIGLSWNAAENCLNFSVLKTTN